MKKLYLTGWQYNSCLIINELAKIVKDNGGKLVYDFPYINTYEEIEIINRSILEEIEENKRLLNGKTQKEIEQNKYTKEIQKQLEELEKIDNTPKKVKFKNYINYYLNDFVYYIQLQDNPYFEDYIQKEETEKTAEGYKVKYNYYMETLKKDWIDNYNDIERYSQILTTKQVKELAKSLFEQITKYPVCKILTNKIRANNYFDDRYHYEYIKEERNKLYKIIENF